MNPELDSVARIWDLFACPGEAMLSLRSVRSPIRSFAWAEPTRLLMHSRLETPVGELHSYLSNIQSRRIGIFQSCNFFPFLFSWLSLVFCFLKFFFSLGLTWLYGLAVVRYGSADLAAALRIHGLSFSFLANVRYFFLSLKKWAFVGA